VLVEVVSEPSSVANDDMSNTGIEWPSSRPSARACAILSARKL
jgi:hypothetical protein